MDYHFPFDLSDEQEARARKLHDDAIVIDMVNMGVGGPIIYKAPDLSAMAAGLLNRDDLLRSIGMAQLLPYQTAGMGANGDIRTFWDEAGLTAASFTWPGINDDTIQLFKTVVFPIFEQLDWLVMARTPDDIRRAKAEGRHAIYWYCQPQFGTGLSPDLNQYVKARDLGLMSLMLTYNNLDITGAGCIERADPGLSYFGIDLIRKCEEIGLLVDVSHCGHKTTLEACKFATKPVTANHICAGAIYDCHRSKTDEEMLAVVETGGIVGVVSVPFFLTDQDDPSIEIMLDHMEHIIGVVGAENVGIATDWPFQAPRDFVDQSFVAHSAAMGFRPEDNVTSAPLRGIEDSRSLRNVTRGLIKRGYSDADISGILGANYLRVLDAVAV